MGDFKSHGVAVCTPRQQQQHHQQLQQEVDEKADVGAIGKEGKQFCTFRDMSHERQPCVPYREGRFVGQSSAA